MELKKSVYFIGGIILSLSLLFSCTIGMGQSLDLEAPQLSVTSHMSGSKVGLEVDLSGTCTDNNAVTRVSIKNVENDFTFEDAVVSGTSWKTHLSLSKDFEGDRTFIITAHELVLTMKTGTWIVEIQFVQKLQSLKNLKQQIYTFQKTKIFPRMKNLLYMVVCTMPCLLAK